MKIGIYIVAYYQPDKLKKCLDSLMLCNYDYDVQFWLGLNGACDKTIDNAIFFQQTMIGNGIPCEIYNPGVNLGKGAIINKMVEMSRKLDYMVHIDGDIIIENADFLRHFVNVWKEIPESHKFGTLAAMQEGENCHIFNYNSKVLQLDNYSIIYREDNATAGACWIIPYKVWEEIGGYQAHRIYASDDGHWCVRCNQFGYRVGAIQELSVYHPPEHNPNYAQWKRRASQDRLSDVEKGGYEWQEAKGQ